MFTQEKQDLINSKDWDGLAQTDFTLNSDKDISLYKFEKDLIFDFYIQAKGYQPLESLMNQGVKIFLEAINSAIRLTKFDSKDWHNLLDEMKKMDYGYGNYVKSRSTMQKLFILRGDNKKNGLLKAYLDPEFVKKVSSFDYWGGTIYVTIEELKDFTSDEVKLFATNVYIYFSWLKILRESHLVLASFLGKHFKTYDERAQFAKISTFSVSDLYMGDSTESIENFILSENAKDDTYNDDATNLIINFWSTSRTVSNDFIEKLLQMEESKIKKIIKEVVQIATEQQLEMIKAKNNEFFGRKTDIFINEHVDLPYIAKTIGRIQRDLSRSRRKFTEDEILEYPNFFDPETIIRQKTGLFVSKETFKKLNKSWGKRQRWSSELIIFKEIIEADDIPLYHLKYLIKKTGVDNNQIISALKNVRDSDTNVKILNKFFDKYTN